MLPRLTPLFSLLVGIAVPSIAWAAVVATDVTCATRCISATEIALNSITTGHIIDGTLTNADLSSAAAISASKIADGSGSTLDADFLDGLNSSDFLRSTGGSLSGSLSVGTSAAAGKTLDVEGVLAVASGTQAFSLSNDSDGAHLWTNNAYSRSASDSGWTNTLTMKDGNVGIGTSTPSYKLDLAGGGVRLSTGTQEIDLNPSSTGLGDSFFNIGNLAGRLFGINAYGGSSSLIADLGTNYAVNGGDGLGQYVINGSKHAPFIRINADEGSISLYGENSTGSDWRPTSANLAVYAASNGYVGIMKTPSYPLDVNGAINASDFCLNGDCSFGDGSTSTTTRDTQAYPDASLSDHSSTSTVGTIAYYLDAMKTTGGTIHLGAGTYTLGGPIEIASNITIVGTGTNSIIKLKEGVDKRMIRNPGASDGSDGTAVSNVTLQDFTLDGGSSASDEDCLVFDASDSNTNDNINISGLTVENCGGNGILIVDAKKVRLNNLYLLDNGTITVDKSYPDHNIYLRNVYDVVLSNVLSTGATSDGVHIADGEKVSVDNVVAWDNTGRGIFLGGVYYGSVSNATVYGNDDNGIELAGDSSDSEKSNSRNLSISGCSVTQNNESVKRSLSAPAGIYVRDTTALSINGCIVRKNNYGIVLATGSIDVIVSGNTSIGNSAYGVYLGSGTEDILVDGNDLQDNTSGSFKEDSSDADIKTGDNL